MSWRDLLSQLHQRHPKFVQAASQTVVEEDESNRDAVEQLVFSLSVVSYAHNPAMVRIFTVRSSILSV